MKMERNGTMPARSPDCTKLVVAGLDPAIHLLRKTLPKAMDTRVKPAYDGFWCDALHLVDSTGYWIARFRGR
jgi:hypothetical protein